MGLATARFLVPLLVLTALLGTAGLGTRLRFPETVVGAGSAMTTSVSGTLAVSAAVANTTVTFVCFFALVAVVDLEVVDRAPLDEGLVFLADAVFVTVDLAVFDVVVFAVDDLAVDLAVDLVVLAVALVRRRGGIANVDEEKETQHRQQGVRCGKSEAYIGKRRRWVVMSCGWAKSVKDVNAWMI